MGAALGTGIASLRPPGVPSGAPVDAFSAERAMIHVRAIASRPHPVGSAAHDSVRAYLHAQLEQLGMQVEIQHGTTRGWNGEDAPLDNIIATRAGTSAGRALVLMAHYDAVPGAPGAGDDAAGVAALLETLRAVGPGPLHNELAVVITDGEELGLRGAELFVAQHPLARRAGLVLNFEARGNSGPSFLFQTTPGNGALIREVARVAPHPAANSLTGEVYRRLPNDTDLSIFLRAAPQVHGLNFAFIDGFQAYHDSSDTAANLDTRSLQHHGTWALALTRRFGALDLAILDAPDAVYFNVPLLGLVHYPHVWALPLAVTIAISSIVVAVVGVARRRLRMRGIAIGALLVVIALAASVMICTAAWQLLLGRAAGEVALQSPLAVSLGVLIGFVTIAIAVTVLCIMLASRRASPGELAVAPLVAWAVLAVAAAVSMPGASWILTWPAAAMILALAFDLRPAVSPAASRMAAAIGAVPVLVLVPPMLWQVQVALTNHVAPFLAGAAGFVVLLITLAVADLARHRSHA